MLESWDFLSLNSMCLLPKGDGMVRPIHYWIVRLQAWDPNDDYMWRWGDQIKDKFLFMEPIWRTKDVVSFIITPYENVLASIVSIYIGFNIQTIGILHFWAKAMSWKKSLLENL